MSEPTHPLNSDNERNRLFPVFLKMEEHTLLIVGGGYVGLEKLQAVLQNAPLTKITLVATFISEEIKKLASDITTVQLEEHEFNESDAEGKDLAIIAINEPSESKRIRDLIKRKGILVNVADQPDLCDFYLGSIVQRGHLKIAISTNGKSPTIAKRLKEWLNEILPSDFNTLLENMQQIRESIKGDFAEKVNRLNAITKDFLSKKDPGSGASKD